MKEQTEEEDKGQHEVRRERERERGRGQKQGTELKTDVIEGGGEETEIKIQGETKSVGGSLISVSGRSRACDVVPENQRLDWPRASTMTVEENSVHGRFTAEDARHA